MDGVSTIQDDYGQPSIVGPGAFIRGTLAEHDVTRQPMIAVIVFNENGTHQIKLVAVPHLPAEQVFDLEKHKKVRREAEVETQFIQELGMIDTNGQTLAQLMETAELGGTPSPILMMSRQYITRAEEMRCQNQLK
jgi:hypothetical protein